MHRSLGNDVYSLPMSSIFSPSSGFADKPVEPIVSFSPPENDAYVVSLCLREQTSLRLSTNAAKVARSARPAILPTTLPVTVEVLTGLNGLALVFVDVEVG